MESVSVQRAHVSMVGQDPSAILSYVNQSAMIMELVPMEPAHVKKDGMVIIVVLMDVQPTVLALLKATVFNHNQPTSLNRPVWLPPIQPPLDPTTITGQKWMVEVPFGPVNVLLDGPELIALMLWSPIVLTT